MQKLLFLVLIFSLIGFVDAVYLTLNHYLNKTPKCLINTGCQKVLESKYSLFLKIPISLFGALLYLTLFSIFLVIILFKNLKLLKLSLIITTIGFLISLYLVYIQAFILKSFCFYCLLSFVVISLILILNKIVIKF